MHKGLFLALGLAFSPAAMGQSKKSAPPEFPHTHLTLLDLPFNGNTKWSYPSMQQSLSITHAFYDWTHWSLEAIGLRPRNGGWSGFWSSFAFFAADSLLFISLPFGEGWMHEEWHRAVMAQHGISSFNDIYNMKIGASTVSVSHETDADMIRLKRDHPADQVRLAEAGMESELALVTALQKEDFFHDNEVFHGSTYWIAMFSVTGYLGTCASEESDTVTDEITAEDGADIPKRDFIGLDCNGWIRDLNRPNEAYEARGDHPSGVGIDRYTSWRELDDEEKDYLKQVSRLTYMNFVDPMLFGFRSFGDKNRRFNGSLKYNLTSFGTDTSLNLFYATDSVNAQAQLHIYQNYTHTFPGLELNFFDIPLRKNFFLSTDAMLWQQPRDFRFRTSKPAVGGRAAAQLDYRNGRYQPFMKLAVKSQGWVQGEVDQSAGTQFFAGISLDLQK